MYEREEEYVEFRYLRRRRVSLVLVSLIAGYGMPSSHAAAIAYVAIYLSLGCWTLGIHPSLFTVGRLRLVLPGVEERTWDAIEAAIEMVWQVSVSFTAVTTMVLVCWSRIKFG